MIFLALGFQVLAILGEGKEITNWLCVEIGVQPILEGRGRWN